MDFVAKRWWYFAISALVIIPGMIFFAIPPHLKLGIDFTGGSSMGVSFTRDVSQQDLRAELTKLGYGDAIVQSVGGNSYFVRTKELGETQKNDLVTSLNDFVPLTGGKEDSFDYVSALIAEETVRNSIIAVIVASLGIMAYITWAFRSVPNSLRFGVCAVATLIHDVGAALGAFAILSRFITVEVNTMFILGLLTVLGYSVHDTIVVFDRIRENLKRGFSRDLATVVNVSIMETIGRSLSTSIAVLLTLFALLLFGGPTIRDFVLVLLIGIAAGTYSSIAIASPLLVMWNDGEFIRLFKKLPLPMKAKSQA